MEEIDEILSAVTAKDAHVLCREVMSITDTMDVLRAKWNVEILTAILCGQTRFKDMQTAVKGISEKVLSDFPQERRQHLGVPQLRPYRHRHRSPRCLSCLLPSAIVFRDKHGELLMLIQYVDAPACICRSGHFFGFYFYQQFDIYLI